jgi:hypothetical protein
MLRKSSRLNRVAGLTVLYVIYNNSILALVNSYTYYINKITFLLAFKLAFKKIFIIENIYISFKNISLFLYNLKIILLKLNIYFYTLLLITIKDSI